MQLLDQSNQLWKFVSALLSLYHTPFCIVKVDTLFDQCRRVEVVKGMSNRKVNTALNAQTIVDYKEWVDLCGVTSYDGVESKKAEHLIVDH